MTFYLPDVQPVAGRITRCTLRVVLIRENCRNSVALSLQQLPADISFDRSVSRKKYPHKQSPVSIGQSVFSRTRLNISSVTSRAGLVIESISGSILVGPVASPLAMLAHDPLWRTRRLLERRPLRGRDTYLRGR